MSRSRTVRVAIGLALGAMLVAFTAAWAIPNVAGAAFVDVRAVVVPHSAANGPTATVGSATPVTADGLEVSVEVTNRYPLSVVLSSGQFAFQASVYRRDDSGKLTLMWRAAADDPALEDGSDSPMGGGSSNVAAVVTPGTTSHVIAGAADPFRLEYATGSPIAPGIYYLRVWAYGIASPLVPISLDVPATPGT